MAKQVTQFDRPTVRMVSDEALAALQTVAERYGLGRGKEMNYGNFLRDKISSGVPLTPLEQVTAEQAGLFRRPVPMDIEAKPCGVCVQFKGRLAPSHSGSRFCRCGSIASGGRKAHCACDICF
jgi:hypothetical protein